MNMVCSRSGPTDTMLTGTPGYNRAGLAGAVQALGGDLSVGVDADRLVLTANVLLMNLPALPTCG